MARIYIISLLRSSSMLPISPLMDELEEKVLLPTFLFSAISSKGIFSYSSSPIGSSNMSGCYLRFFLDYNHQRREKVGCVKQWGCWANIFLNYLYSYEA